MPPGRGALEDIFQLPEVINGIPQVFALLPHAASLMLRAREDQTGHRIPDESLPLQADDGPRLGPDCAGGSSSIPPHSRELQAGPVVSPPCLKRPVHHDRGPLCGRRGHVGRPAPIATSKRLLVMALGRVEPTGYRWADTWKREMANPGVPPLLQEPVRATVRWQHKGPVRRTPSTTPGHGLRPVALTTAADGVELVIDGRSPGLHWELVAE